MRSGGGGDTLMAMSDETESAKDKALKVLETCNTGDPELDHVRADDALLAYLKKQVPRKSPMLSEKCGATFGTPKRKMSDVIGTKEAAAILGLSEQMVRRLARRKNFRVLRRRPLLLSRRIIENFQRRRLAYQAAQDGLDQWNEPEYMI